jgi:2-oxo-4-hydroxy-4-carboxy-5-ureidoimidazoline decarboxylase
MTETQAPNPPFATLQHWNALDARAAADAILPCNGSRAWADNLVSRRPFANPFDLTCTADIVWRALPASDWQQAFDSHPRIGEHHAKSTTPQSLQWSSAEQSAAQLTANTQPELAAANRQYEAKFGRIFIVCATGKSSAEMLALLRTRLSNDPPTELREAAEQQRQITQIRLRKWLARPETPYPMGLTTHILDTALGRPAANVSLTLSHFVGDTWQEISSARTDIDGRCKTLLGDHDLQAHTYKIRFETVDYFAAQQLTSIYPYVEIVFTISDPTQHYHIPLLLTANSYTTYRGS